MNYQRLYDELIQKARSEGRTKGRGVYYEAHHIVPKCLGGEGKVVEYKTHSNIILLTAKEHFLGHYYLTKIYPDNLKLAYAFWMMCNQVKSNNRRPERDYSEIANFAEMYEEVRTRRAELGVSEETRAKLSKAHKGKTLSKEHRAKMSIALKGRPCSEETRAKISAANKGRRLPPLSEETKAKRAAAAVARKGRPGPTKGKVLTEEHKTKISSANKGKPKSEEHKAKLKKPRSEEARAKMSIAKKGKPSPKKGVPLSEERKAAMRETWKLRKEGKFLNKS